MTDRPRDTSPIDATTPTPPQKPRMLGALKKSGPGGVGSTKPDPNPPETTGGLTA